MDQPSLNGFTRVGTKTFKKICVHMAARFATPDCTAVHFPPDPEEVSRQEMEGLSTTGEDFDHITSSDRVYALRLTSNSVDELKSDRYVVRTPIGTVDDIVPYLSGWHHNGCLAWGTPTVALNTFAPVIKVLRSIYKSDDVQYELVPVDVVNKIWKTKTHTIIFDPPKEDKPNA